MLVANMITLVRLLVPIDCYPMDGQVHREVAMMVIRCTMKRLTHLLHCHHPRQEPRVIVNGHCALLIASEQIQFQGCEFDSAFLGSSMSLKYGAAVVCSNIDNSICTLYHVA